MFLSISTTHSPATDLGWLLHKRPDKVQTFDIAGGRAIVFYPEATEVRCTATLLLDVDTVDLVRTLNIPSDRISLQQYVNEKPYTASSFLTTAISKVYSSAMNGLCKDRPELLDVKMPFEVVVSVIRVSSKNGEAALKRLFEPLGYEVEAQQYAFDETFTEWGDSPFFTVKLRNTLTISDLLQQLYVLLGVFDNDKHYSISKQEIEKLMAKGDGWLSTHPQREFITRRYLRNIGTLTKLAMRQFEEEDVEKAENSEITEGVVFEEKPVEKPTAKINLHQQRLEAAAEQLKKSGVKSVVDMGCGEGRLIRLLLKEGQFDRILGVDVSMRELQRAKQRLDFDEMSPRMRERLDLMQGSVTYRDRRLEGFEGMALVEVIEHLDEDRLSSMERVVFEFAQPKTVVVTTPNGEYNVKYETLTAGDFRHDDHRFEWSRPEFEAWATKAATQFGYSVTFFPVGDFDEAVGAPSQMGVFKKN
jgi:3' terminal RNA ribose 2'-O-methyltransferase Hen1